MEMPRGRAVWVAEPLGHGAGVMRGTESCAPGDPAEVQVAWRQERLDMRAFDFQQSIFSDPGRNKEHPVLVTSHTCIYRRSRVRCPGSLQTERMGWCWARFHPGEFRKNTPSPHPPPFLSCSQVVDMLPGAGHVCAAIPFPRDAACF